MLKNFVKLAALLSILVFGNLNVQADTITDFGIVSVPSAINYGQSFTSLASTTSFYDDYTFTISGAAADSITSSINFGDFLGVGSLRARLYTGNGHYTGAVPAGQLLMEAWGNTVNLSPGTSFTTVVLNPITLAAGTYTLQIQGTVTGAYGGSYAGVLNLAPVPEPGEWALILSGLGLIGFIAVLRKPRVGPLSLA